MSEIEEKVAPATSEEIAKIDAFSALYSKWLAARAVHQDPTQPDDDESADKRADAREEAERQLFAAPAPTREAVWRKWEALELAVVEDCCSGMSSDGRSFFALGSIKADLVFFGFGT